MEIMPLTVMVFGFTKARQACVTTLQANAAAAVGKPLMLQAGVDAARAAIAIRASSVRVAVAIVKSAFCRLCFPAAAGVQAALTVT